MALKKNATEPEPSQPFHTGDRVRKARELVGEDRLTFAETIGVHRETLARYEESGKVKRSVLIAIAWHTPVRLEWLETGELPWLKSEEEDPSPTEPGRIGVQNQRLDNVTPLLRRAAS